MRYLFSIAAVAFAANSAPAQVAVRPPVVLRGYGDAPLAASRLQVLAGQFEMEVGNLRAAAQAADLPLALRMQVNLAGGRAALAAAQFRQRVALPASPAELLAAHAAADQPAGELAALLQTAGDPAVNAALTRLRFADDRLHALLAGAAPAGGDAQRLAVARLAASVEEHVNELRAVLSETVPPAAGRTLSLQLRQVALAGRQVAQLAAGGVAGPTVTAGVTQLVAGWQSVTPQVALVASQAAAVRLHAAQVDQLVAELARVAGGVPAPLPGFGVVLPAGRAFVVGAGEGGGPRVRVFHELDGQSSDFYAYDPNFQGGVRVALADLNGDGFPDIVTAPGPGMPPLVRVFDGRTLTLLTEFVAYAPPFDLGTFVAAADLTADGRALVAVGPGVGGGPHVKVFDIAAGRVATEFFAYGQDLRCGARVALADVDGDGVPDLVTVPGPAPGIGPQVKVFSGRGGRLLREFNAFDQSWRGGLYVAAADVTKNGRAELIVSTDGGGVGGLRVFDPLAGRLLADWLPYGERYRGGVRVATFDVNGDGVPDIVAGPGPGVPGAPVKAYDGRNRQLLREFVPFDRAFGGGAFVGGK